MVTAPQPSAARDIAARSLAVIVDGEIFEGGSSARVYRGRSADGADVVLKVVAARPGMVDGHDLASFRGKETQQDAAGRVAPRLGARYLPVLRSVHTSGWAAQVTPYFPSEDLASPLRRGEGPDAFFTRYSEVARDIYTYGYGAAVAPAPADYLDRVVIDRFFRRFGLVEQALPELAAADTVIVNGRCCTSPRRLLRDLRENNADQLTAMAPAFLGFAAHGDANTRNVLLGSAPGEFRLIDPRGSTSSWDPVYDLAKALFSLSVWDPALRWGCVVRGDTTGSVPTYQVGFRGTGWQQYGPAVLGFLPFVRDLPAVRDLLGNDPHWAARLLFTHDMHVLAEAACRLSDDKPRVGADGLPSTPTELAMCHYLLGTLLLNDLADQLRSGTREFDVDRHFSTLPR